MGAFRPIRRWLSRRHASVADHGQRLHFLERYRDIVSDPLNLLIVRHPKAGRIEESFVYLHNGLRVHWSGESAYYGSFSEILVINRGVHEPLQEYVFQELLKRIGSRPRMIELGAYWGHYSMWLKAARPAAEVILVEADAAHLEAGRLNFRTNAMQGEFIQAFIGDAGFRIDTFLRDRNLHRLDILHADIDGAEVEMLAGAADAFSGRHVDYAFISTHGNERDRQVREMLQRSGYRVEVASDSEAETTSFDGLIFATSPNVDPLFSAFSLFGRNRIESAGPDELLAFLKERSMLDRGGSKPSSADEFTA
jgi:hypothetical protein